MPVYKQFFPRLTFIASVAAFAPSHICLARAVGKCSYKHQNKAPHKNDMLESPMQVAVNGPVSTSEEAGTIVQAAVARWLTVKDRTKLARK